MLTQLKIQNLALVDRLDWQMGGGLLGITGETGAGKSVIVGALKLVLGERAEKSLIRTGEATCSVEAVFELPKPHVINGILEESGLEACEEGLLIVKRVISSQSNRQYINNSPVTLSLLKVLGQHLVDLHGPHDHQGLFSVERQLSMLDAYAGAGELVAKYRESWLEWKAKTDELEELTQSERASSQELDLLRFQVEEIDAADLDPNEEEEVESRYKRASNATRLLEAAGEASRILGGDDSVMERLSELQRLAVEMQRNDPETKSMLSGLDAAIVELSELEIGLRDYVGELEIDPSEALQLEQRINTFETLKRKYGTTLSDVLDHRNEAAERLHNIENRGEVLETLEREVELLRESLDAIGAKLSLKRKRSAPKLAREIVSHLSDLGFKQALFEIGLEKRSLPSAGGLESVEFQFGPNPGEPIKSLRSIASSGEISRVMLAVKSALAEQDATPLMVFDEIDANVGGEIARAVGEKMAVLGEAHQVIAITHFPQVAAVAAHHYLVSKDVKEGRTLSQLDLVAGKARIDELVRMLGGGGDQARAMAESLLQR